MTTIHRPIDDFEKGFPSFPFAGYSKHRETESAVSAWLCVRGEVTENWRSWYDSMIPWGHVHSFMRDRSSIWRRITVAARTGPHEAIITDNCGWLTPCPTRGSPYPRSRCVSCLVHVGSSHKWTGAIRQQDVCGKRKKKKPRPEVDQSSDRSGLQKIWQRPFRERKLRPIKDPTAFWIFLPWILSSADSFQVFVISEKKERSIREVRFIARISTNWICRRFLCTFYFTVEVRRLSCRIP